MSILLIGIIILAIFSVVISVEMQKYKSQCKQLRAKMNNEYIKANDVYVHNAILLAKEYAEKQNQEINVKIFSQLLEKLKER